MNKRRGETCETFNIPDTITQLVKEKLSVAIEESIFKEKSRIYIIAV
jgi:hypothetical protein